MTSAGFHSLGNSAFIKQLSNIVFIISEHMVLVDFRRFVGIPFDLVAFLALIRFSSLSISDKPILLNEKHWDGFYSCLLLFQLS